MNEAVHELGALRALREVGRHGSIAAAAGVLGVSQQALSARMRNLERAMGLTLLARTPSGSHLTEQGRLVVGWAEDVLDAADGWRRGCGRSGQGCRTGWRSPRARPSPSTSCRTGWSSCGRSS